MTAKVAASDDRALVPQGAWIRAFRRLPPLQLSGVYALPLQIFATLFAAGNVAFLGLMLASPWLALAVTTIVALSVWMLFRRVDASGETVRSSAGLWAVAVPVALALCLLGGEGRLFYANLDWQVRDAVLSDLSTHPWPVRYPDTVLRAPLGMYVLPSLLGRALGLKAANLALLAQNTALLASALVIFMAKARTLAARLVVLAMFVAFSGWDIVGTMWIGRSYVPPGTSRFAPHIEWWAYPLQYSSLITDLFWAPNHALPAWALVAGYLAWRNAAASSLHLAALLGLTLLWSPLIVMGALPFVLLAGLADIGRKRMGAFAPATLVPLAASLLPVAIYLTLDDGKVIHGANWMSSGDFLHRYARFTLVETFPLLLIGLTWAGAQEREARIDFLICAVLLVAIPFYRIGGSNDFMMRASIFPITLIFVIAAQGLSSTPYSEGRQRILVSLLVLTFGFWSSASEIVRAVMTPANPPRDTSLAALMGDSATDNYTNAYMVSLPAYEAHGELLRAPASPRPPDLKNARDLDPPAGRRTVKVP